MGDTEDSGEDRVRAFTDATQVSSPDGAARLWRIDDRREPRIDSLDAGAPDALVAKLAPTKGPNPFGFFVDEHGRVLHTVFDGYRTPPGKLLPEVQSHLEPVNRDWKQRYVGWLLGLNREVAPGIMSDEELAARQGLSAKDRAKAALPGMNGHGYVPQTDDQLLLTRLAYAEASNTPDDYVAIGWSTINRIGQREFGYSLNEVMHQPGAFAFLKEGGGPSAGSDRWRESAHPELLTGPNLASWKRAEAAVRSIYDGSAPDPTGGGTFFFSSDDYKGTWQSAPRICGEC
ncbi:MAG: Cell Wall Hydrolase [Caulobacter sp.]|nr:Cell Wall Hydrolase [Caulobacter sp.]